MREQKALEKDIFRRLDPKGEFSEMVAAFEPLLNSPLGRGFLRLAGRVAGFDMEQLSGPLNDAKQLLGNMSEAILLFTPMGWAPSGRAPTDIYAQALEKYRQTESLEQAEDVLVDGWNHEDRLRHALMPLKGLGAGHDPLREKMRPRVTLIDKALQHHQGAAYEASVPIVLAQIDGIVWDLTDPPRGFFTGKGKGEHLVDENTIAGVPEGLKPLRALFSQDMKESGATGRLTRHGILHGRELGYDTKVNSTKAFVLLIAVIEWALPKAREIAERLEKEREERYAGSKELDEFGRRLDRRGFTETKESVETIARLQFGFFERNGHYAEDVDAIVPNELSERWVHGKEAINMAVSDDRNEFWAWRETPTGFFLGVAGRAGYYAGWLYAGEQPPSGGTDSGSDWRHVATDPSHPDW